MDVLPLLLVLGQAVSSHSGAQASRPPEVLALVDQGRALPAEFRADILLRLAQSSLITQTPWKQELIEEAFWSGSHASLPYLQRADGRSDSVATNAVRANGLEAMTLQARAVQQMLPLNPGKALQLFDQIQPTTLPKLACSNPLTPDVAAYYQTAALVFRNSFTAKQRANGEDRLLLKRLVASVDAPAQVPPVMEMVFAVNLAPDQRRDLLSLLTANLQDINRSDREYGAAETALVSAIASDGIRPPEAAIFLPALRSYIVRHLKGHRCTDNMPAAGRIAKSGEQFNSLAAKLDPTESRWTRISAEEAKPAGDDGTYRQDRTGRSERSQAVTEALKWLTHGNRVRHGEVLRWTLEERSSPKWLGRYDDAAKLVHELKEDDEASPEALFVMKSDALNFLAALGPPGQSRDKALEEYREFLEEYYPSIENVNLWFTMFRHMLYTARFSEDPKNRAWILDGLARSSNPIIALYSKIETSVGPPPGETHPRSHRQAPKGEGGQAVVQPQ
jgi:hypothetical protein